MPYLFFPENKATETAQDGFATGLLCEISEESVQKLKEHFSAVRQWFKDAHTDVGAPSIVDVQPRLRTGVLFARAVSISGFTPENTVCVENGSAEAPGTYFFEVCPENALGIEDGTADKEFDLAEMPNDVILTKDGFESVFRWDDMEVCVVYRTYDAMIAACDHALEEMQGHSPTP